MRHYIAIASLAMFFSAGSHAEDWSLSTWQHGPRSQVAYEASSISKAQPKWRATAHRHRQRRPAPGKGSDQIVTPEHREVRLYRAEDKPGHQGVKCQPQVRGLGTQWIGTQGALDAAKKDWMEHVRYDLGESYLDLSHAEEFVSRCGRVSIGEAMGQVMYRCEILAKPCKAPFGTTQK